jgi:hypothetical protein
MCGAAINGDIQRRGFLGNLPLIANSEIFSLRCKISNWLAFADCKITNWKGMDK